MRNGQENQNREREVDEDEARVHTQSCICKCPINIISNPDNIKPMTWKSFFLKTVYITPCMHVHTTFSAPRARGRLWNRLEPWVTKQIVWKDFTKIFHFLCNDNYVSWTKQLYPSTEICSITTIPKFPESTFFHMHFFESTYDVKVYTLMPCVFRSSNDVEYWPTGPNLQFTFRHN